MNLISHILPLQNVLLDLEADSKKRVFERAGLIFENQNSLSRSAIIDSLTQREKLGSTGLGQGIAIPHGRIKGLKEALGAFFRLASPIQFDAPDGRAVNLIFVMLVPEQANESHLRLLSELAQMFSDRAFRDDLLAADSADTMHSLFVEWDPHAANERRSTL
ncbi:PTS IIA-like nitrogen regulatory protein PtsN [Uliginosibacterium sp. H1]|uniref:PTS IIA-like nitrogen regulatory protein PtsN n=1 Tax=Uliginosibacterium sp. H1 TaxID=3114757 RepID=UPI002E16EDCD|nr:PTS IIA-like nitrogen regulatory protein PtsN [Uliginosibacterium sp. H1]